jgi:hypothetical protein
MVKSRFSFQVLCVLAAMAAMGLPAQERSGRSPRPENPVESIVESASESPPPLEAVQLHLDLTTFRIDLTGDHPLGVPLTNDAMRAIVEEEGLEALKDQMEEAGAIEVVMRLQRPFLLGKSEGVEMGGDVPFINQTRNEDGSTTSMQQSMREGVSVQFRCVPRDESGRGLDDFEFQRSVSWSKAERISSDGYDMIGRLTFEIDGATGAASAGETVIDRTVQRRGDSSTEWVLVWQFSR